MAIVHRANTKDPSIPRVGNAMLIEEGDVVFLAEIGELRAGGTLVFWGDCERFIPWGEHPEILYYGGLRDTRKLVGQSFSTVDEAMAAVRSCPIRR